MQGCTDGLAASPGCRTGQQRCLLILLICVIGCDAAPAERPVRPIAAPVPIGNAFDPATVGGIHGSVCWQGDIPSAPPFRAAGYITNGQLIAAPIVRDNPNLPRIDPRTHAVQGAMVCLRGIDPARSHRWDLPPVQIELRDLRLHVHQGEVDSPFGFVRQGDRVTMVSHDRAYHMLWLRGAAFFSLPFPDPDQALERPLDKLGLVELSSGAGYPWMRGYLFVTDHPYWTRTDEKGLFRLEHVPPGRYRVVCWMPNWKVVANARDPESALVLRVTFGPPVETMGEVEVWAGKATDAQLNVPSKAFR
ncbi:MAG TPA: hypothetical protein VFA18_23500 [Gemmataceae bacterium]|nr:hypothetical protein [Gemmataceae bacterium]